MFDRTEYNKQWYEKNKVQRYNQIKERRESGRQYVFDYKKNNPCVRCGFSHPAALDFHHKDHTTKTIGVADAVSGGWSLDKIKEEIEKCDLLCANCHRILHYEENTDTTQ